jgi:hypothetical protein
MSNPTVLQVANSIFAAAIGVQSNENRQRDFQHGSFSNYVIGGLVFTVLFVSALLLIVSIVL